MIFGYTVAVIAGFLVTAIRNRGWQHWPVAVALDQLGVIT